MSQRQRALQSLSGMAAAFALAIGGACLSHIEPIGPWLLLSGAVGVAQSVAELCMAAGE